MAAENVLVTIKDYKGSEEEYFAQQEKELIKKLRADCEAASSSDYAESHKNHCFRCGTPSLVEVKKGDTVVDICVNDGCGAVHLDPGELEAILDDKEYVKGLRKSIFNIFK
ncbi:MAG: hypothetical protein D6E12_17740 [Desulfovibrio sp.]|nr:MAG: hypothetical protein D6E12_17740 [Desulfovibrio sp.]